MSPNQTTSDAFLSYAVADRSEAMAVSRALAEAGISVFDARSIEVGGNWQDELWEALVTSQVMVAVVSPASLPNDNLLVELGAASAWRKPVMIVWTGPAEVRLPVYLESYRVFPLSRLDDLVQAVRKAPEPLRPEEQRKLIAAWRTLQLPTDELLQQPDAVERLARTFNRGGSRTVSSERLLQELVRLRRRGELPRLKTPA
jgi:hypothetical protein